MEQALACPERLSTLHSAHIMPLPNVWKRTTWGVFFISSCISCQILNWPTPVGNYNSRGSYCEVRKLNFLPVSKAARMPTHSLYQLFKTWTDIHDLEYARLDFAVEKSDLICTYRYNHILIFIPVLLGRCR